jgi:pilus assembly protein CpaE
MNAPFNASRGTSLRDSFSAYVCDDATADLLRPIAVEHGWAPEKVNKGGLRNAVQSLSVSASPNILFVDLSESGDPLNDINALAEVCEPGTVVIAAGQVNDVRLYRDLVASGIQDYLLKPFTADQVRDAFANAQMTISGPRVNEPSAERPHVMAAVIGVRGGVGASTIATSLAWLMGDKAGRATALLDLDIHFGTGALSLDLEPGRGLTDAIENPSRIDGLFIERAMVRANDKLSVLSAEAPINQPLLTDGSAYFQLQEEMRAAFETTIIDLPRAMLVQHPHLVHDAHVAIVVVEFTLAATRDAIRILSWLKANAPQSRVIVVANKAASGSQQEISRADFEKSIERKVDVVIPLDAKAAAQSAKLGQPLSKTATNAKISQPLGNLVTLTVSAVDGSGESPEEAASTSLLGKLGNLKGLVAKKPKPAEA